MSADTLAAITPGFADPVHAAQQVFRASLEALAHPGRLVSVPSDAEAPAGVSVAAHAVLLALLDQDTTLFVSPAFPAAVAQTLRFHTGCRISDNLADADFILLAAADGWPDFNTLKQGSEYSPEHSATLVREVTSFSAGVPLALTGPGIADTQSLQAPALDADFIAQWQAMRQRFPRGVDALLTHGGRLVGLSRTTRICHAPEAACM